MKSLFKISVICGSGYGAYTFYNNRIRPGAPDPKLHEKKNKKIVVVGAGIVGISTAYYLGQYEDNQVVLLEQNPRCA